MVQFKGILIMGEMLRKSPKKHITLKELKDLLVDTSGSFHERTIRKYMETLQKEKYIKDVSIDGVPMFEILQEDEK
jgi:hydrogenase maturation factor HypF (carbamoyltransferase family)